MLKSIQSRTLAALLLAVVVTALLSAWLSYRSAKQILLQEAVRALRITADAKKEELLLTLKRQEDRSAGFLENNLIDCLEIRDVRCVRMNLDNFAAGEGASGAVVRLHGGRQVAVGKADGLLSDPDRSHVRFETTRGVEGTYALFAHSEKAGADIGLRFPVTLVEPIFSSQTLHLGDGGEVFVVDGQGTFLSSQQKGGPAGSHHAQSLSMTACLAGKNGEDVDTDYRGVRVMMAYRYLEELGGGCIMAHMDESVLLAPAKRLRYEMVGIAIPLVLMAALFAFVLSRRMTRPMLLLTERVRRLQKGDFDSTISIQGPTEIQTFAETFAAMVTSLRRSREQQRVADEKLRESEKLAAAGRLAATIAHEVNNPLAGAINSLYLLRDKVSDSGRQFLDGAEEQLRRVAGITRQTLGFYRENASRISFDLQKVVDDLLETLTPRARNKGIEIQSDVQPTVVFAVQGEIQQVIANLVTNAIDASPDDSKIRVRARRFQSAAYGDAVQLSVGDCGPGIPPALRHRIWEPFFTTKEAVGTGLGLWVCKQIVERHEGTIRAHSTRKGTVFTVILPQRVARTGQAAG